MSTSPVSILPAKDSLMETSLKVLKISQLDAEDTFRLIQEYYEEIGVVLRDSREALLHALDDPKSGIWVAYLDSIPVGCVMLRPLAQIPCSGEVKRLYVRSDFRGRGIAHVLMQALEQDAMTIGTEWLYLDTKDDLKAAIHFYEQNGYERCARYNNNPQATIFMRKQLGQEEILVRPFRPGDEPAFRTLNEEWIAKYFTIEKKDREILDKPVEIILKPGGQILFAVRGGQTIGCCALLPMEDGSFEVSKMAVTERERGHGIGRTILEAVIDYAKKQKIRRLYLETNSRLGNAIHLYESLGFKHIPEASRIPSPYARADVFMDLYL
jgi:N-acetylglutamate synthase-like GNAT family acetyltransferase